MNKQIKRFCVTVIMVLAIYCICSPFSYALVWQNWRECVNEPDCIGESSTLTLTLKTYIIESAGYFLNSHSDYQAFLNRVEISEINGINYNALRETLYCAIDNMEKAKATYINLMTMSEKTSYNYAMIDQLMKFDYDSFRVKYGLLGPIFAKVKAFLCKGDIVGLDNAVLINMDNILRKLCEVKAAIDRDQFPEIAVLWRINQEYADIHLFGQYVSEVFKAILGR